MFVNSLLWPMIHIMLTTVVNYGILTISVIVLKSQIYNMK